MDAWHIHENLKEIQQVILVIPAKAGIQKRFSEPRSPLQFIPVQEGTGKGAALNADGYYRVRLSTTRIALPWATGMLPGAHRSTSGVMRISSRSSRTILMCSFSSDLKSSMDMLESISTFTIM